MRRKRTGVSVGTILYVVLIVILSLVLVIQISYIASELRDDRYDYSADEDDYIRMTTYENYYRILDEATNDSRLGKKHTEVEQEIRALGFYYEAATLYKAYLAIDDILLLMTTSPQRSRKPGWTDLRRKPDPTDLRQAISTSCSVSAER